MLLSYLRTKEKGGLSALMGDKFLEELLLSFEHTVCVNVGLPEPPASTQTGYKPEDEAEDA